MQNLPLIKGYAQGLIKLLKQDPSSLTSQICVDLERIFLNSHPFKDIDAVSPAVADDGAASAAEE